MTLTSFLIKNISEVDFLIKIQHFLGGIGYDPVFEVYYDTILSFNTSSHEWNTIGNITHSRYEHAVSTVPEEDVLKYCQFEWNKCNDM